MLESFGFQFIPFLYLPIGAGVLLTLIGSGYRHPALAQWDLGLFRFLHNRLHPYAAFFRLIWRLGRTPLALLALATVFLRGWKIGLLTAAVYFMAVGAERVIKLHFKRPRPFDELPEARMLQPNRPHDPSHPSGDALRVWYLALVIPLTYGLSWQAYLLMSILAATLSLGRVVLGVHYPLDVLGGAGLGLSAAGVLAASLQLPVFS